MTPKEISGQKVALGESPGDYLALFSQAPVGLALLHQSTPQAVSLLAANDSFSQMLGYDAGNPLDASLGDFMPPVHFDMLLSALSAIVGGEDVVRQELQFITRAGQTVACQIGLSLFKSDRSSVFILSADDITVRKVAEQRRLAEFGIEQREDFIATLTHDLKTPIVGANMVLSALLDGSVGALQAPQVEIIRKLKSSNQDLLKMIHNLLDIYRYESGPDSLSFYQVDLCATVHSCVDEMQPLFASKRLNISVEIPSSMPVVCDEQAIQRVLTNLLSNAVKFTPEAGYITISAQSEATSIGLQVKDSGAGISAKHRDRLFQRFWRGEPGKRYAAGTGLGLYFCHSVIRSHGGNIECQSTVGNGTTFKITLPLDCAQPPNEA